MLRRVLPILLVACLTTLLLFTIFQRVSWRALPQAVGLGEEYGSLEEADDAANTGSAITVPQADAQEPADVDPNAWRAGGSEGFKEPKVESKSPYPVGQLKPAGSNYTKCLVMPKMTGENVDWVDHELGDLVEAGLLTTAVYGMDDDSMELRPPRNKGNEVMAYLSYIIDFYDDLPDVALFMHAHRWAWHNNLILGKDASLMVRHLSAERVTRDGYMNLRCHWDPGCPDWLHPGAIDRDYWKQEESIFADYWNELFPEAPIPTVLAQPCCAQFAVSRERIRAVPKERFIYLRDWVLHTELSDFLSGRIFEYTWQYIFSSTPLHCPSMSACYCDGYGLCFGDAEKFDYYFELNYHLTGYQKELKLWNEQAETIAQAREQAHGRFSGEEALDVPEVGRNVTLREEITKLEEAMKERREAAFELGRDPRQRAKEAGRVWVEGDGF
ncbi:uncharacterized protein LTR77_011008 [Saxophila tyrrhenica]|uniref:Uncharacterized protein n=1 Tax=Saxophila tyrrhenica TaxID=1690608 RepID=A0AAV9NTM1_9PEZI|nr:hypothetical protein LTR77_011008 [Saxophila tyrrhenica]